MLDQFNRVLRYEPAVEAHGKLFLIMIVDKEHREMLEEDIKKYEDLSQYRIDNKGVKYDPTKRLFKKAEPVPPGE